MAKKKSKAKLSASLFKITGPDAKLKVKAPKKLYYLKEKIKPEKAQKLAAKMAAELFETSPDAVSVKKPSLKYEFYINCDAVMEKKLLVLREQEIGLQNEVAGVLVGKQVLMPKSSKEPPTRRVTIDMVELYDITRTETEVFDGRNGYPARALAKIVKGPGRKPATSAWIRKAKVVPGKYNSIEKFLKAYQKTVMQKPKNIKRVASQTLTFKKLEGVYVPTYYVKVTHGSATKTVRVNAVDGTTLLG